MVGETAMPPPPEFSEGTLEVKGVHLRYFRAGHGYPVVVLDPMVGGLSPLHHALAVDSRVTIIELPASGDSTDNPRPQDWRAIAGTMAPAVDDLVPENHTLIGTSVGANVAVWQVLQTPDRVEALVLISPTVLLPMASPQSGTSKEVAQLLLAHPENLVIDSSIADGQRRLAQLLQSASHDAEVESRLDEISCPTLVVFGSKDRVVAPEAARLYREKIPNSNVSIVYDAGHLIAADRPEALINAVADYVERRETFIVARQSQVLNP